MSQEIDAAEQNNAVAAVVHHHASFVQSAYLAAFDRIASDDEIASCSARLDAGENDRDFLAGLMNSEERKLVVEGRRFPQPHNDAERDNERFVTLLYRVLFDREADASGLETHLNLLAGGTSHVEVLDQLRTSDEANLRRIACERSLNATANVEEFIVTLFDAILHRNPEPSAIAHFAAEIRGGRDVTVLTRDLASSPEARTLRGQKHSPALNATCSRLALYLEGMLRRRGVVLDQGTTTSSELPIEKAERLLVRLARTIEMMTVERA